MNKKTIFVSAIVFLLSLFTACDMADSESARNSGDKAVVRVNVAAANRQVRTVMPSAELQDITEWRLLGGIQGDTQTELMTFTDAEGAIVILEVATWDFTLNGYKGDDLILTGTLQEHTISPTETNTLNFTVGPLLEGEGTLNITIELPAGSGITTAKVFKDEVEIESVFVPVEDKIVFTGPYDAGAYYFSIRLYKGSELYGAVSEMVHVWANLLSEKTYTLTQEDLKITYIITYHLWGGNTETDYYQYTDAAVTLPTPSRLDHIFRGWYEKADFSGGAVSVIPAGSTGNKDFYEKWTAIVLTPGSSLAASLVWLAEEAEEDGVYIITLNADEDVEPTTLSYSDANVSITIKGDTVERKVSLNSSGSLLTVESGVTLTLDNNITLQGRNDNTASLVQVNSGGTLDMKDGSKISGNTSDNGGGVRVSDEGVFTMSGGEISGNTATCGGGVYVDDGGVFTKQAGGTIYGSTAGDGLKNTAADGDGYGYAVYIEGSPTKIRDITAHTSVTLDGEVNGGAGGWETLVPNNLSLAASLAWVKSNAEEDGIYTITVTADALITPTTLSYDVSNVNITLKGDTMEREVSLISRGSLFIVGNGVTLTLNNNITLQGRNDNTASLVQVNSGGTLVMNDGSKINGNTSDNGGGVHVSNGGTFTMSGGEISGNVADRGGGVYADSDGIFTKQSGGTIYGSDADSLLKNTAADGDGYGHAVYIGGSPTKIRNTTAGSSVTLDSAVIGAASGWEVLNSIQIDLQPVNNPSLTNASLFVNESAGFNAGTGYVSWQWYWDGELIAGAVSSTYTLAANSKTADIYELSVVVITSDGEMLSARCRVIIKAN